MRIFFALIYMGKAAASLALSGKHELDREETGTDQDCTKNKIFAVLLLLETQC